MARPKKYKTEEERLGAIRLSKIKWVKANPEFRKEWCENNQEKVILSKKKYSEKPENRGKAVKRGKEYRKTNPEYKKIMKIYYEKNKLKRKEQAKKRNQKNPHILAWRTVLKSSLRRLGKSKEGHTIDLLGYSTLDLKNHMISLFTEGMNWGNHGEWHIDHKKSVNSFNKETLPSIVNALSNLQPLWATTREINGVIYEGNLNKYNKY